MFFIKCFDQKSKLNLFYEMLNLESGSSCFEYDWSNKIEMHFNQFDVLSRTPGSTETIDYEFALILISF